MSPTSSNLRDAGLLQLLPPSAHRVNRLAWRACAEDGSALSRGERIIPDETAIAFSYQGASHAVMMGTPDHLEDFAVGFSLTEQIVTSVDDIEEMRVQSTGAGINVQLTLANVNADAFWSRRRHVAGPSGCGLCGIESLEAAVQAPPRVSSDLSIPAQEIADALAAMMPMQELGRMTRAVHAAGFWTPAAGIVAVREDVGRHNALDKLIGALARARIPVSEGVGLLTSRISVELVQKAAIAGMPILVAVSAPTSLAVSVADQAGITLVAVAREDGFEIFTHSERIGP